MLFNLSFVLYRFAFKLTITNYVYTIHNQINKNETKKEINKKGNEHDKNMCIIQIHY